MTSCFVDRAVDGLPAGTLDVNMGLWFAVLREEADLFAAHEAAFIAMQGAIGDGPLVCNHCYRSRCEWFVSYVVIEVQCYYT